MKDTEPELRALLRILQTLQYACERCEAPKWVSVWFKKWQCASMRISFRCLGFSFTYSLRYTYELSILCFLKQCLELCLRKCGSVYVQCAAALCERGGVGGGSGNFPLLSAAAGSFGTDRAISFAGFSSPSVSALRRGGARQHLLSITANPVGRGKGRSG